MRPPVKLPGADGGDQEQEQQASSNHPAPRPQPSVLLPPRPARPQLAASGGGGGGGGGGGAGRPPMAVHPHQHQQNHFSIMTTNNHSAPQPFAVPAPSSSVNNTTMNPREAAAAANARHLGGSVAAAAAAPPIVAGGAGIGSMLTFPNKAHPFPNKSKTDGSTVRTPQSDSAPTVHDDDVVFNVQMQLPSSSSSSSSSSSGNGEENAASFFVKIWGPRYLFDEQHMERARNETSSVVEHRLVLFLHGAGMSSMSFHLVACAMLGMSPNSKPLEVNMKMPAGQQQLNDHDDDDGDDNASRSSLGGDSFPTSASSPTKAAPRLICMSYDLRGHGRTHLSPFPASQTENIDYSLQSFTSDTSAVLSRVFSFGDQLTRTSRDFFRWAPDRSVCIVGHSVGGSIASALSEDKMWRQRIFGLVLLDIVEGTAIESLKHMPEFLRRRPPSFSSEYEAVMWFVRTGGMRSSDAARVSVPSLLKLLEGGDNSRRPAAAAAAAESDGALSEDDSSSRSNLDAPAVSAAAEQRSGCRTTAGGGRLTWICNLAATEPAWPTWFKGMDERFLHAICPRMLCLSSPEKLDKDLTVAHMQGQFQFEVFRECGHYVHEDAPDMVAPVLLRFITRTNAATDKLRGVFLKKYGSMRSADAAIASVGGRVQ